MVKASTLKIAITGGRDGYYRVDIDVNKNEFFNEQFFCSKDHVYVLDKNSAVFIILTKLIEQIKRQAAPILEYVN